MTILLCEQWVAIAAMRARESCVGGCYYSISLKTTDVWHRELYAEFGIKGLLLVAIKNGQSGTWC